MDGGVGDFERVSYGDSRVYVAARAACCEGDTESVVGVALGGGDLVIRLLFDGEAVEELEGPGFGFRERGVKWLIWGI